MDIELIRLELGYTQQEMANYLGISRCAYYHMENGRMKITDKIKAKLKEIKINKSEEAKCRKKRDVSCCEECCRYKECQEGKTYFENTEGVINFIADGLAATYLDYMRVLGVIKEYRYTYLKVIEPKKEKILEYNKLAIRYRACIKHEVLLPEEEKFIKNFKRRKVPEPLTAEEMNIIRNYESARKTKEEIEQFYEGEKYKRFTLNKGIDGNEVIRIAREKVDYIDLDLYRLTKYDKKGVN